MLKEILKEEMGISNEVNGLVKNVKELIANDFNKNKNKEIHYTSLNLGNNIRARVFVHNIKLEFEGKLIPVLYSVLINPQSDAFITYSNIYQSNFNENDEIVFLYMASRGDKIAWDLYNPIIQHELHHMYQHFKKQNNLLSKKEQINYSTYVSLIKQNDRISQIVGKLFYYTYNAEKDALMNEFYRIVMEYNEQSYNINPIDMLNEYPTYVDLKVIKYTIEKSKSDVSLKNEIESKLKTINVTYDNFIKIAEKTINNYIKAFGRTISKCKHDLMDKHKGKIY